MPMGTLSLPLGMINAAYSYAERESVSVVDLFASLLHRQYGYEMKSLEPQHARRQRTIKVSQRVRALRGVAASKDNCSYRDAAIDSVVDKYESL